MRWWLALVVLGAVLVAGAARGAVLTCNSQSDFTWSTVAGGDWDCSDGDSPGADDHFVIGSTHTVTIDGDITQGSGGGSGVGIEVNGDLVTAPSVSTTSLTITLNDGGLDGTGSITTPWGVVDTYASPATVSAPSASNIWIVPDIIPCPGEAVSGTWEEDCDNNAAATAGNDNEVGFHFDVNDFGPFSGGNDTDFDTSFDEIQAGDWACFYPFEMWGTGTPTYRPAQEGHCYVVVSSNTETSTDRVLILDMNQGVNDNNNAGMTGIEERHWVESTLQNDLTVGSRDLCVTAASYAADDDLGKETWVHLTAASGDVDETWAYKVMDLDHNNDDGDCSGTEDRLRLLDIRGVKGTFASTTEVFMSPQAGFVRGDPFHVVRNTTFTCANPTAGGTTCPITFDGASDFQGVAFAQTGQLDVNVCQSTWEVWVRDNFQDDSRGSATMWIDADDSCLFDYTLMTGGDSSWTAGVNNLGHGVAVFGSGDWDENHAWTHIFGRHLNDDLIDVVNSANPPLGGGDQTIGFLGYDQISRSGDSYQPTDGDQDRFDDSSGADFVNITINGGYCFHCVGHDADATSHGFKPFAGGDVREFMWVGGEGHMNRGRVANTVEWHDVSIIGVADDDQGTSQGWFGPHCDGCVFREVSTPDTIFWFDVSTTVSTADECATVSAGNCDLIMRNSLMREYTFERTGDPLQGTNSLKLFNNAIIDAACAGANCPQRLMDSGNPASGRDSNINRLTFWNRLADANLTTMFRASAQTDQVLTMGKVEVVNFPTGGDVVSSYAGATARWENMIFDGNICQQDSDNSNPPTVDGGFEFIIGRPLLVEDPLLGTSSDCAACTDCGAYKDRLRSPGVRTRTRAHQILKLEPETLHSVIESQGGGLVGPPWSTP